MFTKVLIANRGAIACRIIRTLRRLGIASVAVHSEADVASLHVREADEAYCIGPALAADSYLRQDRLLDIARRSGAQAIHPGYGFLSENPGFAQACEDAGIAFIGPTPEQMRAFGLKHSARALAEACDVPLLPGSGLLADLEQATAEAARIGYPVMLKSTAGGGGIGMRLVRNAGELAEAFGAVQRLAQANFKDAGLFLEKFVERARHVEVQIFGDGRGGVIALGERDCSAQRRNQKVVEETPAPGLSEARRQALQATAVRLAQQVSYRNAGTVEFVLDADSGEFWFLEVNTRLQVEHGVTEQVCGVDLVEWMVRQAAGDLPPLATLQLQPQGAAIQVRLYAEDPARQFQPATGVLTELRWPEGAQAGPGAALRIDSWVERGTEVSAHYDPMLAKLIVTAPTRDAALVRLRQALADTRLAGFETNLAYLRQLVADPVFAAGRQTTRWLSTLSHRPQAFEVLDGGVQTTVQDWPARTGHWDVGVPPSGPMDAWGHRVANALVGNAADAAALECTMAGPTLRFHTAALVAVTGAPAPVTLDGVAVPMWQALAVPAGGVLAVGRLSDTGCRLAIAVGGGIDVPRYLGSRSTFTLGQFGGHAGRALRVGDMVHLLEPAAARAQGRAGRAAPPALRPAIGHHWDIGVLYGPHGAPDFFTPEDVAMVFGTDWQVHYNSSRTGVRLIGPKPQWARRDGGEAGLHPSNIHDNAYAVGAIDFTGDMPVILGPDGPSLGGFVCPGVVVDAELWKLGQLRPGDTVRFHRLSLAQAEARSAQQEAALAWLAEPETEPRPGAPCLSAAPQDDAQACPSPVLLNDPARDDVPAMVIRQAGDRYLLVEFGPLVLDIELRLRVHVLMQALQARQAAGGLPGLIDLTPGIRSLQLHFDPARLSRDALLALLQDEEARLPAVDDMAVPSRVVHLPLAWNDSQTRLAIEKYMQSVRPDAPWCPSNIEFIRRINDLDSVDAVQRMFFDTRYLVMGLGDVYLGAPVATPLDPRQRLVTTKYNPARTWTPENAVGIGGAYLCVYGMEGPGGYQFVGRTVQMWNRWRHGEGAAPEFAQPWLLRFFDQLQFHPVSEDELMRLRQDFPLGRAHLRIEETTFRLKDYRAFLAREADSIAAFKARQQAAFEAERERWRAAGQAEYLAEDSAAAAPPPEDELPDGAQAVASAVQGSVWQRLVAEGDTVEAGQTLLVVESMKMEFPITAPRAGTVLRLSCQAGGAVQAGQTVAILQ
ncbi:MAG: 2-oxoglutarate carboxylase small subunit [Pseudomonadota bacterium]|jgi:urea carboxylase